MTARVTIEIPFKEWLHEEAARLSIKPHTLAVRLNRGRHPWPAGLKRGKRGRAIAIVIHNTTKLNTKKKSK